MILKDRWDKEYVVKGDCDIFQVVICSSITCLNDDVDVKLSDISFNELIKLNTSFDTVEKVVHYYKILEKLRQAGII